MYLKSPDDSKGSDAKVDTEPDEDDFDGRQGMRGGWMCGWEIWGGRIKWAGGG